MLNAGLTALLNADTTLTSLVAGRIYPVLLPESPTYPAITYRTVSSLPAYTLTNVIYVQTRVEFCAWASTYAETQSILDALRVVLDRYTGTLPYGTDVRLCIRAGRVIDSFEPDSRMYTSSIDFKLTHSE